MRAFLFLLALCSAAAAHEGYQDWVNRAGQGCCNNRDCRPLADSDMRLIDGRLHVLARGVGVAQGQSDWCEILPHHYLQRGNAPDPSTAHVCISDFYGAVTPCAQLICFQPAAQF